MSATLSTYNAEYGMANGEINGIFVNNLLDLVRTQAGNHNAWAANVADAYHPHTDKDDVAEVTSKCATYCANAGIGLATENNHFLFYNPQYVSTLEQNGQILGSNLAFAITDPETETGVTKSGLCVNLEGIRAEVDSDSKSLAIINLIRQHPGFILSSPYQTPTAATINSQAFKIFRMLVPSINGLVPFGGHDHLQHFLDEGYNLADPNHKFKNGIPKHARNVILSLGNIASDFSQFRPKGSDSNYVTAQYNLTDSLPHTGDDYRNWLGEDESRVYL